MAPIGSAGPTSSVGLAWRGRIGGVILAQITDTHILAPGEKQFVDNNAMLAKAIESLNSENPRPDAVVATGDLTNWGYPEQYTELAKLASALEIPFFPMVGNHDDRALMKQTFPDMAWADGEHASWVLDIEDTTLIGFDSIDPGQNGAAFDDERGAWLDSTLSSTTKPVILAMHHPPFTTSIAWMDEQGFRDVDDLRAVIADHSSRIIRILSGHFHRPIIGTVAGVTASVCLSTVHHIDLDLRPVSEPAVIFDPRGYQLHVVNGSEMVSHTRYIDTGEEAFDPEWD